MKIKIAPQVLISYLTHIPNGYWVEMDIQLMLKRKCGCVTIIASFWSNIYLLCSDCGEAYFALVYHSENKKTEQKEKNENICAHKSMYEMNKNRLAHIVQCDYGSIVEICCAQLEPIECMYLRFIAAQVLLHTFFGIFRFDFWCIILLCLVCLCAQRIQKLRRKTTKTTDREKKKKKKRIYNNEIHLDILQFRSMEIVYGMVVNCELHQTALQLN